MFEQIVIALTGMTAIWLTQQSREGWKKYACLFGLCGQPFWFYSAYQAEQWGILALSIFYTYSWLLGFKNHWLVKEIHTFSLLTSFKCRISHGWTCAIDENIKPTPEQLANGVGGFFDYAKMYCERCGHVSELSKKRSI